MGLVSDPLVLADEILSNLRSAATTTAETLRSLRTLLGQDEEGSEKAELKANVGKVGPAPRLATNATAKRPSKNAKSSNPPPFEIYESFEQVSKPLAANSRQKLATEAFNTSLKCLTGMVKVRQEGSTVTNPCPPAPGHVKKSSRTVPLQQCSPNRKSKPARSTCKDKHHDEDVDSVADCASAALLCLRELGNDAKKADSFDPRLEQGALVFSEKLVSLGSSQKALTEIVKVHQQYQKRASGVKHVRDVGETGSSQNDKIPLTMTLDFQKESKTIFGFATSYQSQVLRLVILLGSKAVTRDLVDNLGTDIAGSPARNILDGLDSQFLDTERAGQQLRTVAQALIKLYSVSTSEKRARMENACSNFRLLVEALIIKSKSWSLLGHMPELDREYWSLILKGLKRFDADHDNQGRDLLKFAAKQLQAATSALQQNGFENCVPAAIINTLADIAERDSCFDDGLSILQDAVEKSVHFDQEDQSILKWRLVSMSYRCHGTTGTNLLSYLNSALASLAILNAKVSTRAHELLLHGARLRKLTVVMLEDAAQNSAGKKSCKVKTEINSSCLRILAGLVDLMSHLMESNKTGTEDNTRDLVLTAFAKTFEAVLNVNKSLGNQETEISPEFNSILQRCVETSRPLILGHGPGLQDNKVTEFLKGLVVQSSHLYWTYYIEVSSKATTKEALDFLEQSCAVVTDLPVAVQTAAALGMKLEKLAIGHLALKDPRAARQSFENAIEHYIAIGALEEAVSSALSGPSFGVWSKRGTSSYVLGKALGSHVRLCLTYELHCASTQSWAYDKEGLSPIQRAVLLEVQVLAATDHTFDKAQSSSFEKVVQEIIKACCEPQLHIYRTRFVVGLLQLVAKNHSLESLRLLQSATFQEALRSSESTDVKLHLQNYAESLRHLASLQWLMQSGCPSIADLKTHLDALYSIVIATTDAASLESVVDDADVLLKQLQAVVAYGHILDDVEILMSSLRMVRHILTAVDSGAPQLVDATTQLASLHLRLDDMLQASKLIATMENIAGETTEGILARIRWTLVYIEYLLRSSDGTTAEDMYRKLGEDFRAVLSVEGSSRQRLERDSLISRSARVASEMAFQAGAPYEAYHFARQCVRISTAIWQTVEKTQGGHAEIPAGSDSDSPFDNLASEMSNLTVGSEQSTKAQRRQGSAYWSYADLHCSALQHAVHTSIHNGLYQDALHYAEQLKRVAYATGSNIRISRAVSLLALISAKGGRHSEALGLLRHHRLTSESLICFEDRQAALWRTETHVEVGDFEQATSILDHLEMPRQKLKKPGIVEQTVKTGIKKAPVRGRAKPTRPIKNPAKRPAQARTADTQEGGLDSQLSQPCDNLKQRCLILRNRIALEQGQTPAALNTILNDKCSSPETADSSTMTAMIMLQQALHELSSDSVKCVLSETAVALPVRYKSARKSGRISFIQVADAPTATRAPKHNRSRSAPTKSSVVKSSLSPGEQLVVDAQTLMQNKQDAQKYHCDSEMLHLAHRVQSKLALLSSTIRAPFSMTSLELVLQSLTPKDIIQYREQLTIEAERATREKAQILTWPDITSLQSLRSAQDMLDCTMDELADLPKSWSIVTISLADNQQEMLMSKITGSQSPFLLRVPLSRSDLELDEEGNFTFADAKAELVDIVTLANESAHDKRGSGNKEARREWYSERENLDKRLEAWLYNIENMWLGGFRGLMNSDVIDDVLVTNFGLRLNKTLDHHLPSRQKSSAANVQKVVLHAHVLGLFLGLGNPDARELDDAVTDLLYFVVDILQFSGEHNAYDEIDFDAMLVEVLDALRSCHDAMSQNPSREPQHTILIVDKEMAAFPWESLPCLMDQSVSRMPSLSSIMQRLKKIRVQSLSAQGYAIPAGQGAYMLNPSSDLASTQSTFEPIFQSQLPAFHSSINQPPTEASLTSLLTSNPLFLYFGHGSGAQYIRGRTIRGLDRCAVTFLMGCSSAKMTEAGKFESYGMPGYYMGGMSGCMAVVGTLWDVTDRDIDRFALKTLVQWGLLEPGAAVAKALEKSTRKKTRGKSGLAAREGGNEGDHGTGASSSLDDAVRDARDACLLRYLNGAAPVVYGVPVYLASAVGHCWH